MYSHSCLHPRTETHECHRTDMRTDMRASMETNQKLLSCCFCLFCINVKKADTVSSLINTQRGWKLFLSFFFFNLTHLNVIYVNIGIFNLLIIPQPSVLVQLWPHTHKLKSYKQRNPHYPTCLHLQVNTGVITFLTGFRFTCRTRPPGGQFATYIHLWVCEGFTSQSHVGFCIKQSRMMVCPGYAVGWLVCSWTGLCGVCGNHKHSIDLDTMKELI